MKLDKTLLGFTIAALMAGCSMTDQDAGTGEQGAPVKGLMVDGYVAQALVFGDTNENNLLDSWEPWALTDGDGFYGTNTVSGDDYCALPEDADKAVHCLRMPVGRDDVLVRMVGGYDVVTAQPFYGTLSMRVTKTQASSGVVATPISSLVAHLSDADQASMAANEGVTDVANLLRDFMDFSDPANDAENLVLQALALRIHKAVDFIAHGVEARYTAGGFNDNADMPKDATSLVYEAFAGEYSSWLVGNPAGTVAGFMTVANMNTVVTAADTSAQALATVAGATAGGVVTANLGTSAAAFSTFVSDMVTANTGTFADNKARADARQRAVEVVTHLLRDPTLDSAAAAVTQGIVLATQAGEAQYMTDIANQAVDVPFIVADLKANGAATTNAIASASYRGALPAVVTGGGTLSLAKDQSTDNAAITFNTDGTMSVDLASSDGGTLDTAGSTLPGTYEVINDSTIVMNVEVAGVIQPVLLQTQPGGGYTFDFAGSEATWN